MTPSLSLPHDRWVEHRQGRLFTRTWTPAPQGPARETAAAPVVLFHDSLGCVALWREFPARLSAATRRTVIAYDRLGYGQSDPRPGRLPLDFMVEEARQVFPLLQAQLGLARFVAFGHSVGGAMAVQVAARLPQACEALITEGAQAFVEDRTRQGIETARTAFQAPGQVARLAKYHGDKAQWVLDAWTGTWLHPDFAAWSLAPVLPRVTSPVLAIHGLNDEYGSARHPELIGRLVGGPAQIELLPRLGHVPHREQPDQVLALLTRFLAPGRLP
ncbi:alpha/beta fold hydrolase [Deinococcus navajonensis]|uniref:Alpha/beta fold hydrolase n=1 Tax=Deinococcus navajonensis TaxID=309884 RepID=A0ABV8XNM7_9DEIO